MIFKKSKVLTDSIVDFVSGKSLRGHKKDLQINSLVCKSFL